MLLKNKGFSAVAVISLALGFGLNTTIFTVVNAILLHPLPVRDIASLVELDTVDAKTHVTAANFEKMGLSYLNYEDYKRQNRVFTDLAAWLNTAVTWSGGAEPGAVWLFALASGLHAEKDETFGNAGEMRNLAQELETRWARRTRAEIAEPVAPDDLPEYYRRFA